MTQTKTQTAKEAARTEAEADVAWAITLAQNAVGLKHGEVVSPEMMVATNGMATMLLERLAIVERSMGLDG